MLSYVPHNTIAAPLKLCLKHTHTHIHSLLSQTDKSVAEFITAFDGGSDDQKKKKNDTSPLDNDVWLVWK